MKVTIFVLVILLSAESCNAGGPLTEAMKALGKAIGKDVVGETAESGAKKAAREALQSSTAKASKFAQPAKQAAGHVDQGASKGIVGNSMQSAKSGALTTTGEATADAAVGAVLGEKGKAVISKTGMVAGGAAITAVAVAPEATFDAIGTSAVAVGEHVVKPVVTNAITKVAVPFASAFPLVTLAMIICIAVVVNALRKSVALRKSLFLVLKLGCAKVFRK
jgi:hypothetical protein